ncbi:MAG: flavodoxin family protein [Desulfopila sp.]
MKLIALNGSPRRKNWNTVTLLENITAGAASVGARVELIQLYDLNYSGCISCFSCKRKNRPQNGVCAVHDELSPVLERIRETDALVIGSPIYYGTETAATRALLERLCFPYNDYSKDLHTLFPHPIQTALVYTMNVDDEMLVQMGLERHLQSSRQIMARHFGPCELLLATDTLQYSDYDQYASEYFDKTAKLQRHRDVFPQICQKAFDLGVRLVTSASS